MLAPVRTIAPEITPVSLADVTYRITVAEQSTATTATAIKELQDSFNDLKGDIRVMREILQRLDADDRRSPG